MLPRKVLTMRRMLKARPISSKYIQSLIACLFLLALNVAMIESFTIGLKSAGRSVNDRSPLLPHRSAFSQPLAKLQAAQPSPPSLTKASIPNLTVSLVKSIVGSGVLALPAGIAALGDSPEMIPYAMGIILIIGVLNTYFFFLVGRICEETKAQSYTQAWERTVGADSAIYVTWTVTLKTLLSCIAFAMILADSVASLTGLERTVALAGTATVLTPLALQRNLQALAPFSFLGVVGMLIATASIVWRYLDGSYALDGEYAHQIADNLQPLFGDMVRPSWQGVTLACSLATAFVAHYNAPRFYNELDQPSLSRFGTVTGVAYAVSALLFILIAVCGFLTFGVHSQGFILNNYAVSDPLIQASRAALAASIALTFPLPFVGLRDGCLELLGAKSDAFLPVTAGLLLITFLTAAVVQDLGLIISVGGGTFSTAVSALFPVWMFRSMPTTTEIESTVAQTAMGTAVMIGVVGVGLSLQS